MQFEVRAEEVANIETEKRRHVYALQIKGIWKPRRLTLLGVGPTLKDPAKGRPLGEPVFTRGRHAIIAASAGGGDMLPLGAITEEHFDAAFDRNVKGVVFTVQKALPLLDKAANGASVILAGSTTGIPGTANFSRSDLSGDIHRIRIEIPASRRSRFCARD